MSSGRHSGTGALLDDLFEAWIVELRRKGRSPNTIDGYQRVYDRNIRPTLGIKPVTKVTTMTLTDLYGAHQVRGLAPRSVYQVHACRSSMFTQACRWAWRDSNPVQWAEPPSLPNVTPVVPTPEEVRALITAAELSRRPEYARAILLADDHRCAPSGAVRVAAWTRSRPRARPAARDGIGGAAEARADPGDPDEEPARRTIAVDELTVMIIRAQLAHTEEHAAFAGVALDSDAYLFSDAADGTVPWKPDSVSQFFGRLRDRARLAHLSFHQLRKFMETYGQEMGYSVTEVALRAGHNPSVAARHYSGKVAETDHELARAIASLLVRGEPEPTAERE